MDNIKLLLYNFMRPQALSVLDYEFPFWAFF